MGKKNKQPKLAPVFTLSQEAAAHIEAEVRHTADKVLSNRIYERMLSSENQRVEERARRMEMISYIKARKPCEFCKHEGVKGPCETRPCANCVNQEKWEPWEAFPILDPLTGLYEQAGPKPLLPF